MVVSSSRLIVVQLLDIIKPKAKVWKVFLFVRKQNSVGKLDVRFNNL